MLRRIVFVALLCSFGMSFGCGGSSDKVSNPNNLEYSKEGPPKRDGPAPVKKK